MAGDLRRRQGSGGHGRGRRVVAWSARAGVAAIAAATLAGFGATRWWPLELFSHFRLQYVAAALLLAVILAALRLPRLAAMAVILAIVNSASVVQVLRGPSAPAAGDRPPDTVRVLSLNVFDLNTDHNRIIDYVRRQQADVVVLAELTTEWMPSIERLATGYPYHWVSTKDPRSGMAMFSRRTPVASGSITVSGSQTPAHLVTIETTEGPLSLLATQAQWPASAALANARNRQLDAIATEARRRGSDALAIIGDLNVSPFSPYYDRLLRNGRLQRCRGEGRWTPTWPTLFPPLYLQLDHCLTTDRVRSWDFTRGEYVGSDHVPILETLAPR
jgi:endonuclease/exonuclease/phosphatase (EEP) superfamily protein YafD